MAEKMPVHESIAFVAVGANIEPESHILAALALLQKKTRVIASSTFYLTEPVGGPDQPQFVNGIWRIRADVGPVAVKNE